MRLQLLRLCFALERLVNATHVASEAPSYLGPCGEGAGEELM